MSDYSWLEPMERRTREIREETQRMKEEIEKMKQESHNLPVPDDAPWLNLSQEEVEDLRNKKHELTEYGKQRLRELIYKEDMRKMEDAAKDLVLKNLTLGTKTPETKLEIKMTEPIQAKVSDEDYQKVLDAFNNPQPYPDTMFEESERREAERKALDALDKLYDENGDALQRLAAIEKEEWERKIRSDTVLARYNHFYNEECSGMPHGTPITPEHMQAVTLECMIDALICENMNVEYNAIAIDDIKDLIARLYQQSDEFLERVRKLKGELND